MFNSNLKRTVPYVNVLLNSSFQPKTQKKLMKIFPNFVADDIVEILYNLLLKNVKIQNKHQRKVMNKHRRQLTRLFNNSKKKREGRRIVRNQRGGFLAAVLPVVASVLASAFL